MGIKLGDLSPVGGALTGKGIFGKGLAKVADSGLGMLVPMSYLAQNKRDKIKDRENAVRVQSINPDEDRAMKRGGKVKKMAKGGSTASKRADGCATKGKTKGRFV